jgi:hypothetical protein
MSRGPGRVEQAIVEGLRAHQITRTAAIAAYVFEVKDEAELTTAQLGSTRRALRRLAARGEIVEVLPVKESAWRLVRTRRRNTSSATR